MYKLLLSWRYLCTRYIALASIISVTLGVATLIIVNSVMAGFSHEMHDRLHGILSDIMIESPGLDGIYNPQHDMKRVREVLGDDLQGMTTTVSVPAMVQYEFRGHQVTQHVMLIGIDEATYADVGDMKQYLLHPENRKQVTFNLREDGYDKRMKNAGWGYRRSKIAMQRMYGVQPAAASRPAPAFEEGDVLGPDEAGADPFHQTREEAAAVAGAAQNPFDKIRAESPPEEAPFDEMQEQYTGVILGISIALHRGRDPKTGEIRDTFLAKPGDDLQITLPSTGAPPKPVMGNFTVVDLYESKMSEYDSKFVFMPLKKLQQMRGMIDPVSGVGSVTSIQIKLKPGADLADCKRRLQQKFPNTQYPYQIRTWKDLQGPLLQAVQLETTILNILLFLIIAVAGFGILATFFMIVVEKTRDIGVLKSLGAPSTGVMSIFLSYGLGLGLVGSGAGVVLGVLFVLNINEIASVVEMITGREVFDPTIYYFQEIPAILNPLTMVLVTIGAVSIAVAASVLPAYRAARLHPVEALRYE